MLRRWLLATVAPLLLYPTSVFGQCGANGTLIYNGITGLLDCTASASLSGTVTSVAESFTGGLISVAGSPITTSGTLALTVAGTSGGIPYFSGATTWASSGALTANLPVIGGGAPIFGTPAAGAAAAWLVELMKSTP